MKSATRITAFLLALGVVQVAPAAAQPPLHYDPYFALPGPVRSAQVIAGIRSADLADVGNRSTVFLTPKFSMNEYLELGARADLGALYEGRDDFSSLVVGGKYRLNAQSAATVNLLAPVGAVDKPGASVGYMTRLTSGLVTVDSQVQVGLLSGYTDGKNAVVQVLVRPSRALGNNVIGHLDIVGTTDSRDIADYLGIDMIANADLQLGDAATVNVGLSYGLAGDYKQDHLGLWAALILPSPRN